MNTIAQCTGCDGPSTRTICSGGAQHSGSISVVQSDRAAGLGPCTRDRWRVVAGHVVCGACSRVRTSIQVQTRRRCWAAVVQGVRLSAGVTTGNGLRARIHDARTTVVQVKPQSSITGQAVDRDGVGGAAASDAGYAARSCARGRQRKITCIHTRDRLIERHGEIHAGGIRQSTTRCTVDAGDRRPSGYGDGESLLGGIASSIRGLHSNVVSACSQVGSRLQVATGNGETAVVGVIRTCNQGVSQGCSVGAAQRGNG